MMLILLTHAREVRKATNTGRLVQAHITNCKSIIWQRTCPDKGLLEIIEAGKAALLYPYAPYNGVDVCPQNRHNEQPASTDLEQPEHYILIDSTWQEARKIFNHSAYLQNIPRIQLTCKISNYHLRRNQVENGLCTAECAIELLRAYSSNPEELAQMTGLEQAFNAFIAHET